MESELDLTKIQNQVMQKIGRNLLNFQQIERMLKLLISNNRVSGNISTFEKNHKQQTAAVHKQTMGTLVGQFVENTFAKVDDSSEPAIEHTEAHISFSFTVEADADYYESKKQSLKLLVDDRNDLIHHLVPRLDLTSIESCLEVEQYLDQQRARVTPEFNYLQNLLKAFAEGMKCHADFINSEEGVKQMELHFLQQNPLVSSLLNISIKYARPDGWMLLDNADRQLRATLPEPMGKLKERYGYKTLRQVIIASEFFELLEEQTKKGGSRYLYRPKPEVLVISESQQ